MTQNRRPGLRIAQCALLALSTALFVSSAWSRDPGERTLHRGGGRGQPEAGRYERQFERGDRRQQRAVRNPRSPSPVVQPLPVVEPPVAAPLPVAPPPEPPPAFDRGRPGRLSPDERRALRQQINDAGRDVYRPFGQ